jgi:acetylornithine/N-succinyldiaminopimelate aminotransferase
MERGEGAYLYDIDGNRYLDFAAGIATCSFGHAHPRLTRALQEQAATLWHCANLFYNAPLTHFAQQLIDTIAGMDYVFFCSSGTEAVESAIKFIKHYQFSTGKPERYRIIVAEKAFHGRSSGALSACGNPASQAGFTPLLDGFDIAPFNDVDALERAITPHTAGILLETIQGEGGIRAHSEEYLRAARALADKHDLILTLDEIQCGYGRTGEMFAYQPSGIIPDIITCAKGIGSGFPLAATLLNARAATGLSAGMHGSTYGGNPLAMRVGSEVLTMLQEDGFLAHVATIGTLLHSELTTLAEEFPHHFTQVRGRGLMLALALRDPDSKHTWAAALRTEGLIVAPAVTDVLRILPPLNITAEHVHEAMDILRRVAAQQ